MRRERLLHVTLLVLLGTTVLGAARVRSVDPQENVRADRTRFFIQKAHTEKLYDIVIVGDSRALRGIAPNALEGRLPGRRVFNFAFHAGGFNPEIFAAAERLLDPASSRRMIIIAPTPLGFIPWKQSNDQFREYRAKPIDQVFLYTRLWPIADFFRPLSPLVPVRAAAGIEPAVKLDESFRSNGWIATNQVPLDRFEDLSVLEEQLQGNGAAPDVIDGLMEQVAHWVSDGVVVVGTFVPAFGPREAMEDRMLEFDRAGFIERFSRSGGTFFEAADGAYVTYDGSHLVEESALEFSRSLADSIAGLLAVGN